MRATQLPSNQFKRYTGTLHHINDLKTTQLVICSNTDVFNPYFIANYQFSGLNWVFIDGPVADVEPEKKAKPFLQRFKGFMKLYLDADTIEELKDKTTFEKHWQTRRYKIMKKRRRYKINLYLFNNDGEKAHDSIKMLEAGSGSDLWQIIVDYAQKIITDNPDVQFDRERSCAVVRA